MHGLLTNTKLHMSTHFYLYLTLDASPRTCLYDSLVIFRVAYPNLLGAERLCCCCCWIGHSLLATTINEVVFCLMWISISNVHSRKLVAKGRIAMCTFSRISNCEITKNFVSSRFLSQAWQRETKLWCSVIL